MKELRQRLIDMTFSKEPEKKDKIVELAKKYNILKNDDEIDKLLILFTTVEVSKYDRLDIKKLCELILFLIQENKQIILKSGIGKGKYTIEAKQISKIKSLLCNELFMMLLSNPYQYRDYLKWSTPFHSYRIKFNEGESFVTYIDENDKETYPVGILDTELKRLMRREETLLSANGKYYVGTLLSCWKKNLLNAGLFNKALTSIGNKEAAFLYDLLGLYKIPIPEYEVRKSAQEKRDYVKVQLQKVYDNFG